MKIRHTYCAHLLAIVFNLALVYVLFMLCRVLFVIDNWDLFGEGFSKLDKWLLLRGSLRFDTSAIFYLNALWILLLLLPLHYKEKPWWHQVLRWVFVVTNSIGIVVNLCDVAYFRYTGRRTTASIFSEFANEGNLGDVFMVEVLHHWWLVLIGVAMIVGLYLLYFKPQHRPSRLLIYYPLQLVSLVVMLLLSVCGMRGGASTAIRPITLSNANQYVNQPLEAGIVLNTPFSMIRTINKHAFVDPKFFESSELDAIYSPVHQPVDMVMNKKNVVVLIVESFGREYMGAYNEQLPDYKSYTPFIDSLIGESLTFDYTFCNGRKSIDGMPSILSGIPMFVEPFFLTPSSLNDVSGIAGELGRVGYASAFFHGAENGSMGFEAFARTSGFDQYYGRTEYNQDPRFAGDKDFDGTWAIWDEEFLQYYALKMNDIPQPFVTSVFTASSHHPFAVPEKYKQRFYDEPGDDNVMHKCIRYVDYALSEFFATAKRQPWYSNTIFVITSDHTNLSSRKEYQTALGGFGAPIIIFDPSGGIQPQRRHCIAQQTDIMPSILGYLGYPYCYVAFGQDLFHTADTDTWAVNYINGVYQFVKGRYLLQLSDEWAEKAFYDIVNDWMLTTNLAGTRPVEEESMKQQLKAIIQSYMQRMEDNQLIIRNDNGKH